MSEYRRLSNEKYGERIFTRNYKAAVVILLNDDNSWDMGYDGGLIECTGLVNAARSDMDEQTRVQVRLEQQRRDEEGTPSVE